jgi:uncharacterized membrane protein
MSLDGVVIGGRTVFGLLAAGLVLFLAATVDRLPSVVASHFDGSGVPNGWSSRPVYAVLLIVIGVALPLAVIALVHGVTRHGPEHLNIPSRDYWTRPEHAAEAVRRVRTHVWWLGCVMTLIVAAIHCSILSAHAHEPPHLSGGGITVVIAGALLGIGAWVASLYRVLRPPHGARG